MWVFLSQSSRSYGEMMAFLRALRNIGNCEDVKLKYFAFWRDSSLCCASFRMTRFCFLLTIRNLNYFWNAKIFFILIMYLREQSWRNSFALKRWGKWCGDVVMWWCGYVVMRWKSRIRNLRHWVLCKTTAPIDNATLTDTIFFSPTLKGGKLFIVSCEFWVFLYAKFFLFSLCF